MDEVTNLVNVLRPQVKNYKERQIRSAILAEGYSEDITNKVIAELFKEQKIDNSTKENTEKKELNEPKSKETDKNYYLEVDKLLEELKKLHNIENNLEIPKREIYTNNSNLSNDATKRVIVGDVSSILENKKKELDSISIDPSDEDKIMLNDGKIINLNDYPRRDWRNYRDQGKTLAQIKNEKKETLRKEIYELKRNNQNIPQNSGEDISDMIFNQLKEKNVDVSDNRVRTVTQNEANKLKDQYKEKQIEKKELDLAVDNIYKQLEQNPNAEEQTLGKKENVTQNKKNNSNSDFSLNSDFNLDMNIDSNAKDSTDNSNDDFDLGLDLNLEDNKKNKKK
jgi:hypothetical protein